MFEPRAFWDVRKFEVRFFWVCSTTTFLPTTESRALLFTFCGLTDVCSYADTYIWYVQNMDLGQKMSLKKKKCEFQMAAL